MQRGAQISKLFLCVCVCVCVWLIANGEVNAATLRIADIPLSGVIAINGQKFVKVRDDAGKGAQFVAMEKYLDPQSTMQGWTGCLALATPTEDGFTQGPTLVDERDGKSYEVRKFADGNCWMVENLAYGGAADACVGKTTLDDISNLSGNAWGYGDCRDPSAGCVPDQSNGHHCTCISGGNCGYLYNWQAATQDASAYYGTSYQPLEPTQGICPAGWHVPSGSMSGEFQTLHWAVDASINNSFWHVSWKGVTSGSGWRGYLEWQGSYGWYWSSTQSVNNSENVHIMLYNSGVMPDDASGYKDFGYAVRCVKDVCPRNYLPLDDTCVPATTIVPNCATTDGSVCTTCANGYALQNGACTEVENCTTYDGIRCTACASGYSLHGGGTTCVVITGTMQAWNGCSVLAMPTGTNFTQGPYLTDARDGKVYEIRKFADGECWMVDNLAYGGGSGTTADYCAGKATFRNANSAANAAAVATNGLNPTDGSRNTLVGDCRDAAVGAAVSSPCYNSTACGYYYNWSAAIQNSNGWYGNSYQPTEPTQGICPTGWHLPSSGSSGEYQALHVSAGSPMTGFWQPGGNWKGVNVGFANSSGTPIGQGSFGRYWSSTQGNANYASLVHFTSSTVYPTNPDNKYYGSTVRCIKN